MFCLVMVGGPIDYSKSYSQPRFDAEPFASDAESIFQPTIDAEPIIQEDETQLRVDDAELLALSDISDKILGFIHGDTFIQATGYEGGSSLKNLRILLSYLKQKTPENQDLITLSKKARITLHKPRQSPYRSATCKSETKQDRKRVNLEKT
jgi:hypothetical protein